MMQQQYEDMEGDEDNGEEDDGGDQYGDEINIPATQQYQHEYDHAQQM
jgi:hypothetical protein